MRMTRPSAAGGEALRRLLRQRIEQFEQAGGLFVYQASDEPLDGGTYDDPHKPKPRREVDADLDGWEPL